MKNFSLVGFILLAIFLGSCSGPTDSKSSSSLGSTNPVSEAQNKEEDSNLGPTGSVDPVNDNINLDDGVTYYDEADPDDSTPLPGTPISACGPVYRQFNNPIIFFQSGNTTYQLQEFSYDSVPFLRNIKFTNDSFTACIDGYRNGMNLFVNTVSDKVAVSHPLKVYQSGEYAHELCGHLAYVQNFNGVTSLNLKVSNVYYLINAKDPNSFTFPSGIPTLTSSITEANGVEACLYSADASFYDYGVSFKPQFKVEAIDMGALNP